MNVLSLFSGIGGIELGLERAGMTPVGQVEIDPWCRQVLAKHWPSVPQHDDVKTAPAWWLSENRPGVDLVCGGFPCQPFSAAGKQGGIDDERWGWPWFTDVVRAVRPRYVLVENVPGLLSKPEAFGQVLSDLADLGFNAEWSVLSACSFGAPHTRDRLFLVAYPNGELRETGLGAGSGWAVPRFSGTTGAWPNQEHGMLAAHGRSSRVVNGVPDSLDPYRVRGLGNAVVPQVIEFVGRCIVKHAEGHAWRA